MVYVARFMALLALGSLVLLLFSGCAPYRALSEGLTEIGSPPSFEDPYLIVDRSQILIEGTVTGTFANIKIKQKGPKGTKPIMIAEMVIPKANAYNGIVAPSATVSAITYNNPATVVGFTLNTASMVAGSFTGDILSFGNFAISGLDDNKLKVCPASGEANGGSVKCNKAKIRVYSATGDAEGIFNNTTDGYNIPFLIGGVTVGVGVANAAYVQTYTIASNKNRLRRVDLTAAITNFPVTMDFTNGGAGNYTATIIVEYVLIKE